MFLFLLLRDLHQFWVSIKIFIDNRLDTLNSLARTGIPILHVCGDADEVVPPEERYKKLGGHIEVLHKPGALHHPHCLENPQPIVDFVLRRQNAADLR